MNDTTSTNIPVHQRHDRRTTVAYSSGASTPEAQAVAAYAPEAVSS